MKESNKIFNEKIEIVSGILYSNCFIKSANRQSEFSFKRIENVLLRLIFYELQMYLSHIFTQVNSNHANLLEQKEVFA